MVSRKVIHCIGDSHTSFFTGDNKIQPEYPTIGYSVISNILTYRIGAPLAYNLCEKNSNSKSNQKLFEIVEKIDSKNSILLLSFGEIDCRAHLLKQAALQNKELDIILNECIERYIKVIHQLRSMGFIVCVWNAIPTAMGLENVSYEYPYFGNFVERNKITAKFNNKLIENQVKYDFQFYGVFEKIIAPDWSTNEKYYFDKIHLNNIMLPEVLKQIRLRNKIRFSLNELLLLKMKIFLDNKGSGKYKLSDRILRGLLKFGLKVNKLF
jgi:hypothetical protein